MNYDELKYAIQHVKKTCKCVSCKRNFINADIHVIACTNDEALMELRCDQCACSTIVTVSINSGLEVTEKNTHRQHRSISKNDILDMKNFLNNFDGNFKKIFKQTKR